MNERIAELEATDEQKAPIQSIFESLPTTESIPTPYLVCLLLSKLLLIICKDKNAKKYRKDLNAQLGRAQDIIQSIEEEFMEEKTNSRVVVQQVSDELRAVHDNAQRSLAELASTIVDTMFNAAESWLIEPMLPIEDVKDICVPKQWNNQEHQAHYAVQILNEVQQVRSYPYRMYTIILSHHRKYYLLARLLLNLHIKWEVKAKNTCTATGQFVYYNFVKLNY